MSLKPSAKRGAAATGSAVLVLGSGMAVGVLAADMQAKWSTDQTLQAAAQVQSDPASESFIRHPLVITRIIEEHVTPEPVVVHRKVYRTVRGESAPATTRRSTTSKSSRPSGGSSTSRKPRTVVAPAPAPPAKAAAPAAPKATSKTS